jgi:hydrogenase expression/formation protein HypE
MTDKTIRLAHGSGGLLTHKLIKNTILKYFKSKTLGQLNDSAELSVPDRKIAFTTDSYVVDPLFFPGGDIGMLAIYGTVNDLAMQGAVPQYISLSLIIEDGLSFKNLERILSSAARAAQKAKVEVVCGDTKVVEKGHADKIFITTSGIGIIKMQLGKKRVRAGDAVIVSGTIGDHGIAIMNERLKLGLKSSIRSDSAPLSSLTRELFRHRSSIHFMRDPTRGGVASVLNEVCDNANFGIMIDEASLPIRREVVGATELLGIDPLYVANEGKLVAIVDKSGVARILRRIKKHTLGRRAAIIGEVVKEPKGVWLKTEIGGVHPILQLEAEGLPRIC